MATVILEEKRNRVRLDLLQLVLKRARYSPASCRCGWNAKNTLAFMQMLEESRLLPQQVRDETLARTIWRIENMREPRELEESAPCPDSRLHWKPDWRSGLFTELNELKEAAGICLQTFRSLVADEKCRSVK